MDIKYNILAFNPETCSIQVEYFLESEPHRFTYNIDLPIVSEELPSESALLDIINANKPQYHFDRIINIKSIREIPDYLKQFIPPPSIPFVHPENLDNVYGDDLYRPNIYEPGKDSYWAPTNQTQIDAIGKTLNLNVDDIVYDLGSGDGRVLIDIAKKYGVRAVGLEYNKDMCELAKRNADKAGVGDKVTFINADFFSYNLSEATAVILCLTRRATAQLGPKLLSLKAGTKIVSYVYKFGEVPPDTSDDDNAIYYWVTK